MCLTASEAPRLEFARTVSTLVVSGGFPMIATGTAAAATAAAWAGVKSSETRMSPST
jgi:hypothetical protein